MTSECFPDAAENIPNILKLRFIRTPSPLVEDVCWAKMFYVGISFVYHNTTFERLIRSGTEHEYHTQTAKSLLINMAASRSCVKVEQSADRAKEQDRSFDLHSFHSYFCA